MKTVTLRIGTNPVGLLIQTSRHQKLRLKTCTNTEFDAHDFHDDT